MQVDQLCNPLYCSTFKVCVNISRSRTDKWLTVTKKYVDRFFFCLINLLISDGSDFTPQKMQLKLLEIALIISRPDFITCVRVVLHTLNLLSLD